MRRAGLSAACAALLAGPAVLSFFAGGYFQQPALWAGLGAWVLVTVAVVLGPAPRWGPAPVRLALSGMAGLAAWTLVSTAWAPIRGSAYQAGEQAMLYTGALVAAALLLRPRRAARAVEPVLAAGTLVVIGYGLSERVLPGLLHFARSVSAEGRLEQPLTYCNAMGVVAALGVVLCARLAGDGSRARPLRAAAAAASGPLGLGLYLSVSRGALFACAAGLVALLVAAPRLAQARAIAATLAAGVLASLNAAPLHGVTSLTGSGTTRDHQGLVVLAALIVIAVASAAASWALTGRERSGAVLTLPRHAATIASVVVLAGLALAITVGNQESSRTQTISSGSSRLVTLRSNRYAYWRVALRAFGDEPLRGVGAGGWAVYWLRDRTVTEAAQDAHSLPLQTAAELGVVGLAGLLALFGGVAWAGRRAHRADPGLAAGPLAGLVVYAAHAPLDWDWQMPAVTLIAALLAGAVLALTPAGRTSPSPSLPAPAPGAPTSVGYGSEAS